MANQLTLTERIAIEHRQGWRFHSIYSNELGRNVTPGAYVKYNETVCEDVLIFERRIPDNSFRK